MRKSSRGNGGMCINPKIGEHPDLFERDAEGRPAMTAVWSSGSAAEPHAQYAKDMSKARVRELPRNSFNEEAWAALDTDDQEYILEHDPESVARVKELVDAFVSREKYLTEPDEQTQEQWLNDDFEYFSGWLADQDEIIDNPDVKDEVEELRTKLSDADAALAEAIDGAINEALRDPDNYDTSLSNSEYRAEGIYKSRISSAGGIYFDSHDLGQLVDPLFPDELEEAIKQINHDTYLHVDAKMLTKGRDLEIDFEVDYYFVAEVNWDKIEEKAREILGQELVEEVTTPPEERIVYKFKDGFYVVDLLSSELAAEGKALGICVGKGQYGYAGAVKRGETKIFSLRRPSGKPLFTIEAELAGPGPREVQPPNTVVDIRQIKGKANRLPGWDAGKDGSGEMKLDEVKKAIEFVHSLGIDPKRVRDLRPAIDRLTGPEREEKRLKELESFLGPRQNPGRLPRLPPNDRPLGFDSHWTP